MFYDEIIFVSMLSPACPSCVSRSGAPSYLPARTPSFSGPIRKPGSICHPVDDLVAARDGLERPSLRRRAVARLLRGAARADVDALGAELRDEGEGRAGRNVRGLRRRDRGADGEALVRGPVASPLVEGDTAVRRGSRFSDAH